MVSVSELHEDAIPYILSFLPAEEAVKTTLLSKTWLHGWSNIPDLDFCYKRFCEKLFGGDSDLHRNDEQVRDKFATFVDNTLRRHNLCINKFELSLSIVHTKLASFVDKWLAIVVAKDVKYLSLILDTGMSTLPLFEYTLPQTIFAANSLINLEVRGAPTISFNLIDQLFTKCYTLKYICLCGVEVSNSTIRRLSSIFPCIEELRLDYSFGFEKIELSNLPNLKKIYVGSSYSPSVDITEAYSLESLVYHGGHDYHWKASLYINIFPCESLKHLSIKYSSITSVYLYNLLSQCPFLETLSLECCHNLEWIDISSTTLKSLTLHYGVRLVEIKIDAPNLNVLDYEHTVYPSFSLTSRSDNLGPSLVIISVDTYLGTSFFTKLRGLLAQIRPSQLSLTIMCVEIRLNIEELRKVRVLDPKPKIENLEMDLSISSGISTCSALLDGMFWSFCPKNLTVVYKKDKQELLKFICKELMGRRSAHCCNSKQIMCWRHYLNRVDVEYIEEKENRKKRSYFDWQSWVDGSYSFDDNCVIYIRFTLNW